jgi:hypothetical protein
LLQAIDAHRVRGKGPLKGKTALGPTNVFSLPYKFHMDVLLRDGSLAGAYAQQMYS